VSGFDMDRLSVAEPGLVSGSNARSDKVELLQQHVRRNGMSVTKIIEVVGRSTESSDAAVKNALAEASKNLRDVKALDVVSVGLRGENLQEWGAHVRISVLVDNVAD
jgi:flavin-binding protein dodecin